MLKFPSKHFFLLTLMLKIFHKNFSNFQNSMNFIIVMRSVRNFKLDKLQGHKIHQEQAHEIKPYQL